MESEVKHKILVVDDEAAVTKAIGRILEKEDLAYVLADSGESALQIIRNVAQPFSIIITDQRMEKMQGTELLEHAKTICPDTQRFLITAYSDIQTIINAVNRGAIQCYIHKPWDVNAFVHAVHKGLVQYERHIENEKLLKLAKKQNAKLYELSCALMEAAKAHDRESQELDNRVREIKAEIISFSSNSGMPREVLFQRILKLARENNASVPENLRHIMDATIVRLHSQFSELAERNGFEMPLPQAGQSC